MAASRRVIQGVLHQISQSLARPLWIAEQPFFRLSLYLNGLTLLICPGLQIPDGAVNQLGDKDIPALKDNAAAVQPGDLQHGLDQLLHALEGRPHLAGKLPYRVRVLRLTLQDLLVHHQGRQRRLQLVGDIPIYVSPDSSDLWTRPELFQTDGQTHLTQVAGCPPDAFAADGQLWGNPLYDWPRHKAEDFAWWKRRMQHATSIYDVVRIDHFRGFESFWAVPFDAETAKVGRWVKGPGMDLVGRLTAWFNNVSFIAEDLGYLTPEVKAMLSASGYPGMKIMQFAFDSREPGNYLPYTYPHNSVVYTGTHDNVTTEGWRQSASPEDVHYACRYLRCLPEDLTEAMICACLASVSDMAIIPMADWLHLGAEARINTPSTQGANWQWRLDTPLTSLLAEHIADLTALYDRAPAAADR